MTEKYCPQCKFTKSIELFYSNKARSDGHDSICADCRKALNRSRKDVDAASKSASSANHIKERVLSGYFRQYYAEHKDTINANHRRSRAKQKEAAE